VSTAILLNQGAGSARSERARRTVDLARAVLKADLHVTATRDPAALAEWMHSVVDGYQTVVVAGGDGSLGVAYNVLAGRAVTLGYIPAGFGNATAHLLRLPRDPGALAGVLLRGDARPIDLVRVDGRLALFAGAGWDARVAARYAEGGARRMAGWASAVARSLPDLVRRPFARVEADGRVVHEGPMQLMVVSTTPYFGRGLLVNPGARPDQGALTARVYAGAAPRFAIEALRWAAGMMPRAVGINAQALAVERLDGVSLPLQADGDVLGERPAWHFEIAPAAVRLIGGW